MSEPLASAPEAQDHLPMLPPDPSGIGRRALLAGAVAGAALGAFAVPGSAGALEGGSSYFQPISPTRICETRADQGGYGGFRRIPGPGGRPAIRVKVAGRAGVAANAVAAVLTITTINRSSDPNWLSAYPGGSAWTINSNMNMSHGGHVVSNLVTVKLGVNGTVDITTNRAADIIVDVAGAYVPTSTARRSGRLVQITPVRVIDTRPAPNRINYSGRKPAAGRTVTVPLRGYVPANAVAVVGNLTVLDATRAGHATLYPTGKQRPVASNVNPSPGEVRAVGFMCELGATRSGAPAINFYTRWGMHFLIDVAGYITGDSHPRSADGLFVPIAPRRIVDTRDERFSLWPGWTRTARLPFGPAKLANTSAVAMNLTVAKTKGPGYFTMHGAQLRRSAVSNLNAFGVGQAVANHVIVAATTKGISCYARTGGEVIFDLVGRFTGSPAPIETAAPVNPSPPPAALPWRMDVGRMGVSNNGVFEGAPDPIVDAGNSWHWTGTGYVGDPQRNVVLFGHRTEGPAPWWNGGIYRFQHELRAGDRLNVWTNDNRVFTYKLVAEYVTSKYTNDILDHTRRVSGETLSLVSCTRPDRMPTSLEYRLVSTFKLVSWAETGR
jgi:hypothetical protein